LACPLRIGNAEYARVSNFRPIRSATLIQRPLININKMVQVALRKCIRIREVWNCTSKVAKT